LGWAEAIAGQDRGDSEQDANDHKMLVLWRGGVTACQISEPDDQPGAELPRALRDSDGDGMPDAWEQEHGLNPNDAADGAADRDSDGYTNVEEYLNSLVKWPETPPLRKDR
jgi:hypothetical protein